MVYTSNWEYRCLRNRQDRFALHSHTTSDPSTKQLFTIRWSISYLYEIQHTNHSTESESHEHFVTHDPLCDIDCMCVNISQSLSFISSFSHDTYNSLWHCIRCIPSAVISWKCCRCTYPIFQSDLLCLILMLQKCVIICSHVLCTLFASQSAIEWALPSTIRRKHQKWSRQVFAKDWKNAFECIGHLASGQLTKKMNVWRRIEDFHVVKCKFKEHLAAKYCLYYSHGNKNKMQSITSHTLDILQSARDHRRTLNDINCIIMSIRTIKMYFRVQEYKSALINIQDITTYFIIRLKLQIVPLSPAYAYANKKCLYIFDTVDFGQDHFRNYHFSINSKLCFSIETFMIVIKKWIKWFL